MNINDIDLIEVNEAFAAVVLRFMKEMNLNSAANLNVNGGAIAMGHPLGATGSMLMGTLCIAGGMGIATIIERI